MLISCFPSLYFDLPHPLLFRHCTPLFDSCGSYYTIIFAVYWIATVCQVLYRISSPHSTSIPTLFSLFYRWEDLRLGGILTCWSSSRWWVTELGHESRPVWLQAHTSLENALFSPNTLGLGEAVWGGGGCSWGMLTVLRLAPENQPLYSPIFYMEIIKRSLGYRTA